MRDLTALTEHERHFAEFLMRARQHVEGLRAYVPDRPGSNYLDALDGIITSVQALGLPDRDSEADGIPLMLAGESAEPVERSHGEIVRVGPVRHECRPPRVATEGTVWLCTDYRRRVGGQHDRCRRRWLCVPRANPRTGMVSMDAQWRRKWL